MKKLRRVKSVDVSSLLTEIKSRIQQAQSRAILLVNSELLRLYWDIGRLIGTRQQDQGWGAAVIPKLASALLNELPEEKGFSERNIKLMVQFAHEYPDAFASTPIGQPPVSQLPIPKGQPPVAQLPISKGQPPVAQLPIPKGQPLVAQLPAPKSQPLVAQIPWAHNVLLMQRIKDHNARRWYMAETLTNGWSRNILLAMIKSKAHLRKGKSISNFHRLLPAPQSDLIRQSLKDPYIFDFLTLQEPFHERELETSLLHQFERFLLELGHGFAFVGRQIHLQIGGRDFYLDLLFYHLRLRCYVVIDLKTGEFKPEYAGKMNFYLTAVDERLRHPADTPSIGLILCQDRNQIIAEYSLRDTNKPIGISEYQLTRVLPRNLQSALPTVEQIEAGMGVPAQAKPKPRSAQARKKSSRQKRKK